MNSALERSSIVNKRFILPFPAAAVISVGMTVKNRSMVRVLTTPRVVDAEEERADWQQSFAIIPDFDFSEFDKESEAEITIPSDFSLSEDEES
jgi:hypothetical protein